MAQRRVSMRDGPLGELFKSTSAAASERAGAQAVEPGGKGDAVAAEARVAPRPGWWRLTALAVLAAATLELGLFAAVAVVLLTRPPARTQSIPVLPTVTRTVVIRSFSTPSHQSRGRRLPVVPLAPRAQTWVLVLNGNGIRGAAASTAKTVRAHGYRVTATADARRYDYPRSILMYKPGFAREAARLGRDLNIPTAKPLDPLAVPDHTRAGLVLIVGSGHD